MAIRKEQVLALSVLAIAALIWAGSESGPSRPPTFSQKQIEYTPGGVAPAPLAGPAVAGAELRASLCEEPSETRSLPPRELAFPPRAPLTLALLPLEPGPDYGHALVLQHDGRTVEGVTIQTAAEAAPANGGSGDEVPAVEAGAGSRQEREARAARTYDQLWLVGQAAPFFGTIEVDGRDRFDIEELTDFDGIVVKLRRYNVDTGRVGEVQLFGKDERVKVEKVRLANTLRNEVQRRVRKVPADAGHLKERAELIGWLLDKAREDVGIYDRALEQAGIYLQTSGGDIEGLRWQQRVLQARGDLAQEFALLDGVQGLHRESAFRYQGLGELKARLSLWIEAEQDLRKAAALAPNDARPHAALAEFLRRQGRSREALAAAGRAEQAIGSLIEAADRIAAVRTICACRLALADLPAARAALKLLPTGVEQPYLEGCVLYAQGQVQSAVGAFRQAGTGPDAMPALLGLAACALREGQWQEAHDQFQAVFEQAPLLRHRAATGLGLLFARLGQFDTATQWLDRALEADPQDPYAHYLKGRTLRLAGQLGPAKESLAAALRRRDDFVHAIAEMAALESQRALDARGGDAAKATVDASKYGDRAVELAHAPVMELYELQGLYHFAAAEPIKAGLAFQRAREIAGTEAEKLFAKGAIAVVDYRRGSIEDATVALQRLVADLPKEDAMRLWAAATIEAIEDHQQKEMLEDRFDRSDLGSIWTGDRDGALGAQIADKRLVFRGQFSRNGAVSAERAGAVRQARNFLAVGCTLELGKGHPRADGFAGVRIETQRSNTGQADLQVQLGVREGKPYLKIDENREEARQVDLTVPEFDAGAPHQLELRVMPRGDAQARAFVVQASWNGYVVHRHDLKTLTGNTQTELKTVLFVTGSKGGPVDVSFDDYRLERRKER
jgi:tetratricopeptide (TPR) repeat protein